jgi:hypothetical protein
MCDEGMVLSRSLGGGAIDVQRTMRECQKKVWVANEKTTNTKERSSLHAEDGVHLNDYGQIAMAFAILKGFGAPAEVSSATIDGGQGCVIASDGCSISRVKKTGPALEFTRLDKGLPLNLGLIGVLSYRFVPIPDELNRYMLTVRDLAAGRYEVVADGRLVGKYSDLELAAGVNLGSATPDAWEPGGPWDAQATVLRSLTDARSEMLMAVRLGGFYLPDKARLASVAQDVKELDRRFERLQRKAAKPAPYHFVVQPEGQASKNK